MILIIILTLLLPLYLWYKPSFWLDHNNKLFMFYYERKVYYKERKFIKIF